MENTEQTGFDLPSWRFRVANLGCVESGELEVKPLTLLCGPNNTGKTWVMYALYGFLNLPAPLLLPFIPSLKKVIEDLNDNGEHIWNIKSWLDDHSPELITLINEFTRQRLHRVFNSDEEIFLDSRFDWNVNLNEFSKSAISRFKNDLSEWTEFLDEERIAIPKHGIKEKIYYGELFQFGLLCNLLGLGLENAFLLPAERNGLNIFFRELSDYRTSLLHPGNRVTGLASIFSEKAASTSLKLASYAEPIANYIDWLNQLRRTRKETNGIFQVHASRISALSGGQYEVDAEGNIAFSPGTDGNILSNAQKLDLHLTSSTVKSLFGLWFYLEHQAKPGDVLMIDEPELNLHPANQRAVARLLARLVNAGIRVVCSTHSDYIVREINSLIMLSRPHPKREELMKRFGYDEEELLKPEQVGAYLFDHNHFEAMPITDDEGIIASTFDEQIHQLNETSDEIYYTYQDSGTEDDA